MNDAIEWHDTGIRADQVLVMATALLLEQAGGVLKIERSEWARLSAAYGDAGAVLIAQDDETGALVLSLGTVASVQQGGADA